MTCKDNCLHYEVCQYHIDEETPMTVSECDDFKNKADYVEVVRCKDCKYWEQKLGNEWTGTCNAWRDYDMAELVQTADDHFCGYRERSDT